MSAASGRVRGLGPASIYVGGRQDGGGGEENVGGSSDRAAEGGGEKEEPGGGNAESGVTVRARRGPVRGRGGGGGWRSRAGCRSLACHP